MSQLWFQAGRQRGLLPVLRRSGEGGKRQCGYGQRGPEQRRCGLVRAEHLAGGAHCAPARAEFGPLAAAERRRGDLAEQKSKAAKNMWIATAVILGVSVLLGLLLTVTGFMTGFMEEFYSGLY